MERDKIKSIINDYFTAWETKDKALYSSTLDYCVKVTDNMAQAETDIEQCEQSFDKWCGCSSETKKYDIKNIIYDEREKKATIFWESTTLNNNTETCSNGCIFMRFNKNKIKELEKYTLAAM